MKHVIPSVARAQRMRSRGIAVFPVEGGLSFGKTKILRFAQDDTALYRDDGDSSTSAALRAAYARNYKVLATIALTVLLGGPVAAQNQPAAGPPVRRIATASAVSTEQIGTITGVRELPNGRILVNDGARRRLVLMDTTLKTVEVVLDSLTEVENSYGTRPGALIPYRGDSTLFIDPASYAMLVIDPAGKVARVRSVPRVEDAGRFSGGDANTRAGIDARGRIVYRIPARPGPPLIPPPKGVPYFPPEPDSAFIVAIDMDTRKIDTLGAIRIPKSLSNVRRTPTGGFNFYEVVNPMPSTDEWTVRSDGVVAFVRGVDYRVDFLHGDGKWTSSPKLPFDWQKMSEEDKNRMIDSVKADQRRSVMGSHVRSMIRWANQYGKPYPANFTVPENYRIENGLSRDWKLPPGLQFPPNYIFACGPNETPTMIAPPAVAATDSGARQTPSSNPADSSAQRPGRPDGRGQGRPDGRPGAQGAGFPARGAGGPPGAQGRPQGDRTQGPPGDRPPGDRPQGGGPGGEALGRPSCIPGPVVVTGGNAPPPPTIREAGVMSASDLPDYRPPFTNGAVRADADANVWIRPTPTKPTRDGPVYDIVNKDGELTDRLQLPQGYNLVGFGRGKVVYLSMRDASGIHLARVLLR